MTPAGPPAAPTNVTATAFDGGATVTFTAPSDGGSPITGYTVTSSPGGFKAQVTGTPPTTSIGISGLTNGTKYTFTVTATNVIGAGPASAASNQVTPTAAIPPPVVPPAPPVVPPGPTPPVVTPSTGGDGSGAAGYWLVGNTGEVRPFGNAADLHSTPALSAVGTDVAVGLAATPDRTGVWVAAANGKVLALGSAQHLGDMANTALARPIVGIAATPTGLGYWLVASDGGIFSFGDAAFQGSTGAIHLNQPIVGMAATPTGKGYWLVASDGGIFSFGDAVFLGSTGAIRLNKPVVGMWPTTTGKGYWFVATDGGVFSFGDATFYGSTGDITLNRPIVGIAGAPGGAGYWFVADDGGVFAFGAAPFVGSLGAQPGSKVVSMSRGLRVGPTRPRRRRAAAWLVAALTLSAAVPALDAAVGTDAAGAATTFTKVAQDTVTGTAQHLSVADNVQAQWGNTIVSVFQMARASLCSCGLNTGWATSKDGGATWSSGSMPGLTASSPSPAAAFARVTDASVTYDARHGEWLSVGAVYDETGNQQAAVVNRSDDGTAWGKGIVAVQGNGATLKPDKTWVACNNFPGPNYGHCYLTYSNVGSGQALGVAVSVDGGLTWSAPLVGGAMYDSAPIVQPNGQLVILGTTGSIGTDLNPNGSLRVARLADSGGVLSWTSQPTSVPSATADVRTHRPAPMRALSKPSVAVDRTTGRIFVAYHGCQFRAGCSQNDVVLTHSDDGVSFSPLRQLAIDPPGANYDHFDAGIGIDPNTTGAGARLGIVFFYALDATCTIGCAVHTGLTTSSDGGTNWSTLTTVSSAPTNSSWLVTASQGKYLTDYNSVVFPSAGPAPATDLVTAVPWALTAPTGPAASPVLAQHLYAVRTPAPAVPASAPGAPTNVTATATNGGATISFSAPADTGGSPIASYTVTVSPDGASLPVGGSPVTLGGLTNGKAYTFRVTATNTAGTTGPASAASSAVTPRPTLAVVPPTPPFAPAPAAAEHDAIPAADHAAGVRR